MEETPERSVKQERLTPFLSDSLVWAGGLLTLQGPGSFHILFLCFRSLSSLVGGNPLGTSALQAGRKGEGTQEVTIRRTPEKSITSALVSRELSDLIMAHAQGVLSSVPLMLPKWPCL